MSEIKSYDPQRFHHFLAHMTGLIESSPSETQAVSEGSRLLGDLIAVDDWLLPDFAQPHPQHYQQYLLYADPADRFSVVSFVWGPGQSTPIHDHTVWGLIGMLRGSEMCQPYSRMSDGRWAAAGLQIQMIPGDVEVVSPRLGDVHKVWNAFNDQVSISIHVYGANIGKVARSVYFADGSRKTFISGYSNVPHMFSGLVEEGQNPVQALGEQIITSREPTVQSTKTVAPLQAATSSAQAKLREALSTLPAVASALSEASEASEVSAVLAVPAGTPVSAAYVDSQVAKNSVRSNSALSFPTPISGGNATSISKAQQQFLNIETTTALSQEFPVRDKPELGKTKPQSPDEISSTPNHSSESNSPLKLNPKPNPNLNLNLNLNLDPNLDPNSSQGSLPVPLKPDQPNLPAQQISLKPEATSPLESPSPPTTKPAQVKEYLLAKKEIALIDVREEDPFAQSHPLFACNMPLGRIEVDAYIRIPRKDTFIVIYDNTEGLAERALSVFARLGYTQVSLLEGGLAGWAAAGGELFKDVNVPSKAFGELVESIKHTPSLSAQEVHALIEQKADVVVMDARRFDEYQTMSIPGAISVPGGELVLRARTLAPKPSTRIIVNCAGRTRSIIGTQSLVNAGIPNAVSALRNGTIGWMLAGQDLVKGAQAKFPKPDPLDLGKAQAFALALAFRSGIKKIDWQEYLSLKSLPHRTTYLFDVRTPEEFGVSHLEGAQSSPGGQLVQETDHFVPVRGALVVLYDTEGVRAYMTGSWLVQLGWEVFVIKNISTDDLLPPTKSSNGRHTLLPPTIEPVEEVQATQLKEWIANRTNLTLVIDVGDSAQYVKRHIPGAWWILRSQIEKDFSRIHKANRYVLTCADGLASRFAVHEIRKLVRPGVHVVCLAGGNQSWFAQGFSTQQGESYVVSPRIDRYRRPYEGTENPAQAMQAYLDWEYGLVEQLKRDGTHGFKVL